MDTGIDGFELKEKTGEIGQNGEHVTSHTGGGNKSGKYSENAILLEPVHRLSAKTAIRFRLAAIVVSWMSVVASLVLGITATVYGWTNDSQSLLSFGLDALLDCMSSVIVLWRFYGGDSIYSEKREKRACALIGFLLIVSSLLLGAKSIWAFVRIETISQLRITLILSGVNVVACIILGFSKIFIGHKLGSRALITDSVITLVGAAISVFTLIFAAAYDANKDLWYLDDAFGILASVFLTCYGIVVLWMSL